MIDRLVGQDSRNVWHGELNARMPLVMNKITVYRIVISAIATAMAQTKEFASLSLCLMDAGEFCGHYDKIRPLPP
jgi:hypothetical protein